MHSNATGPAGVADLELLRFSSRQLLRALARLRYTPRPSDSLGRHFHKNLQELVQFGLADVTGGISTWVWLTQTLGRINDGSADANDFASWAAAGSRTMSGILQSVEPDSLLPHLSIHTVANVVRSRIMDALAPITALLPERPEHGVGQQR
ncbi:hypothetical protein [Streptomyces sp. NPDC048266]|uniref:hypothetical protein n=1 Tax=Streptomyces sp. NPDC048266 TaxID=3155787 RepID=UPI0033C66972